MITLTIIRKALKQHCNVTYGLKHSRAHLQWFYTFKAIICLLLNLEGNLRTDYPVTVAWTDGGSGWGERGTVYWGERFAVGWGVFSAWRYALLQDSSD